MINSNRHQKDIGTTTSRQLKSAQKKKYTNRPKSKVKFTDDLILSDSIKYNDVAEVRSLLKKSSQNINLNKKNPSGIQNFILSEFECCK